MGQSPRNDEYVEKMAIRKNTYIVSPNKGSTAHAGRGVSSGVIPLVYDTQYPP